MGALGQRRVCSLLRDVLGPGLETDLALEAGKGKAARLADGLSDPCAARALQASAFVGATIGTLALARTWSGEEIAVLRDEVAHELGAEPSTVEQDLFRRTLEGIEEAGLPGLLTIRAILTMLRAFTPLTEASLWATPEPGALQCLAIVGAEEPSRRVRAAARETLLTGRDRLEGRGLVHSMSLPRWDRPLAALVFRAKPADRLRVLPRAAEAARSLTTAVERATLLSRNGARERALNEASERRVARLAYDIHDGPVQDIAMLTGDVRLLRRQVELGLLIEAPVGVILGRLDDLEARLGAVDRELRSLAVSLDRWNAVDMPLIEAVRAQIAGLEGRLNVAVRLDFRGNPDVTTSQRLAILALIREGLVNVREHSRATEVRIRISAGKLRTLATIEDDGQGFDVERTLPRAARRGRLGLLGLRERIRLLGGRLEVESSPGGPTRVTAVLPHWEIRAEGDTSSRAA
jgi:signal transduction histidine kinase